VKKASEYRQHAEECRALAKSAGDPAHRDMLLNMAETWQTLAHDRDVQDSRQQRIMDWEQAGGGKSRLMRPDNENGEGR
jgi:hypothetical protein